jgi:hypothetical protein
MFGLCDAYPVAARCSSRRRLGGRVAARLALSFGLTSAAALGAIVGLPASPSDAAAAPDALQVGVTRITPAVLDRTAEITVGGIVRNAGRQGWSDVKVYLAAPTNPLVARGLVRAALASGNSEAGPRVVDRRVVARLGTLRPGQARRFSITLSSAQLGLSGADGVYPLGVQALGSPPGKPGATVVGGGATTLLPLRATRTAKPAPTTVLWPFLLPGRRLANGGYAGTQSLAAAIAPRGQMRNLLDLALTTPRHGSDAVLDPSLFSVLEDMTRTPGNSPAAAAQRHNAAVFLADLTRLADRYSCASVGYDRPDMLALAASSFAKELNDAIDRATEGTLDGRDLDCMRIDWPSPHAIDRMTLTALRRQDVDAVIVDPWAVPAWNSAHGNLVNRKTAAGSLPLVVRDRLDAGAAGIPTPLTLRQTILSEAVLTSMASGTGVPGTSTVTIVDPGFNPGRVSGAPLAAVFNSPVTDPANFAARVRSNRTPYLGGVPDQAETKPISSRLVTVAADAAQTARLLDGILVDDADRTGDAQLVARLVSQRWRGHSRTGLHAADHAIDELSHQLAAISVEGPEALALSSGEGQFPITVGNRTPHRVRVALGIDSSAPGVRFKGPHSVEVSAGESRTVTVNVDLGTQTATTVSVRLSSKDGLPFGASTVFNVRSTQVGAALWIAIGVSVAFVAVALLRRFASPGHRPSHTTLPPDDFDD